MRKLALMFISSCNRASIAASIRTTQGSRSGSTNTRFASRRGMMAGSICRSENSRPSWEIWCSGICRGRILLSPRRCLTKTSPRFQILSVPLSAERFCIPSSCLTTIRTHSAYLGTELCDGRIGRAAKFGKFDMRRRGQKFRARFAAGFLGRDSIRFRATDRQRPSWLSA